MKKEIVFLMGIFFWAFAVVSVSAQSIDTNVKTVLASNGEQGTDPRLKGLTRELQSVFRYSSYKLIAENRLKQRMNETGKVGLPGGRVLQITPMKINDNRLQMKLSILKSGSRIFNTVVQLRNGGSITVGGPKHQNGFLLFNISSSF